MHLFIELAPFSRAREGVLLDGDLSALQSHLASNPMRGTWFRAQLRRSRPGSGKRGGVRVLYYVQDSHGRIWLLTLYAKSAQRKTLRPPRCGR